MENISETNKKIKYLIADTTAFINAVPLNEYAENVLTVPDVVAEVRNKRQIRRLCVLPYDLQVREPSTESMRHCVEFAKKTGDYASLSGIDLKVIALTYELEATNVGTEHLRNQPVLSQVIASKEKPAEFADNTKLAGWYNPKGNADSSSSESEDDEYESDQEESKDKVTDDLNVKIQNTDKSTVQVDAVKVEIEKMLNNNEQATTLNDNLGEQDEVTEQELEQLFEKLKCDPLENDQSCDILIPEHASNPEDSDEATDSEDSAESNEQTANTADVSEEQADDGDWITPTNIKQVKKSLKDEIDVDIVPLVACMSTDYAVQNVLKQMNLNIAALNGRIIKQLRTYILRCYACYKTTSIMTKVFCPNCGNKTLKRVAVSLDENGKQVIHINTRRPLTSKYKNQSLPKFRGGKHSHNPILFEDQPIPRQMPSRVAKTKTNALEEDYIAGFSPFVMRDVDSKSAMLRSKGHVKEWARNNTYEEDRRKKHYNRLYK